MLREDGRSTCLRRPAWRTQFQTSAYAASGSCSFAVGPCAPCMDALAVLVVMLARRDQASRRACGTPTPTEVSHSHCGPCGCFEGKPKTGPGHSHPPATSCKCAPVQAVSCAGRSPHRRTPGDEPGFNSAELARQALRATLAAAFNPLVGGSNPPRPTIIGLRASPRKGARLIPSRIASLCHLSGNSDLDNRVPVRHAAWSEPLVQRIAKLICGCSSMTMRAS